MIAAAPAATNARTILMGALTLILFAQTFGELQSGIAEGFTVQKFVVPLATLCVAAVASEHFLIHRHSLVLLAFVLSTLPSLLLGDGLDYLVVFAALFGYVLLVNLICHAVRGFGELQTLLRAYLWGHAVVAVLSLLAISGIFDLGEYTGRPLVFEALHNGVKFLQGTQSNPNSSALHFVVGLPICLYMILSTNGWRRWPLILLFLSMTVQLGMTFGRSAMIGTVVGCTIMVYFGASQAVKRAMLITLLPVAVAGFLALPLIFIWSASLVSDNAVAERGAITLVTLKDQSTEVHGAVLHGAMDIAMEVPPWGLGYGNTESAMRELTGYSLNAHNAFLGITISYGLPSLVLYLAFCGLCIREVFRAILSEPDLRRRGAYAAILGGIVGFLVSALAHEDYVNSLFWTMLALALASGRISSSTRVGLAAVPISGPAIDLPFPDCAGRC
jgi:O-antigen ligase